MHEIDNPRLVVLSADIRFCSCSPSVSGRYGHTHARTTWLLTVLGEGVTPQLGLVKRERQYTFVVWFHGLFFCFDNIPSRATFFFLDNAIFVRE
jgi:hypothetical protein